MIAVQNKKGIARNGLVVHLKKGDWILAGCILLTAILAFVCYMAFQKDGSSVRITVDGQEYGTYSLNEDRIISINHTNTLVIQDGKADMTEANCPDGLCIHQKAISHSGETIICLPNKIVVNVQESNQKADMDSIAR